MDKVFCCFSAGIFYYEASYYLCFDMHNAQSSTGMQILYSTLQVQARCFIILTWIQYFRLNAESSFQIQQIRVCFEISERIAETDSRIRRAMEEREELIDHLLRKLQAQYSGSEKEEGSSVQLVQMCATLASAGKQLAAVQDTSDWAARKQSLSKLLGADHVKIIEYVVCTVHYITVNK